MRVQVWRAPGSPTPGTDYADRLVAHLEQAGHRTDVRPVTELVGHVPAFGSVHVLSGGEVSVRARRTWPRGFVPGLRELARAGVEGRACVVGVCFGAQALAESLCRGAVGALPTLRVGLTEVRMAGTYAEQAVPAFHYERVSPRFGTRGDVTVLAEGSFPAVQAYAVGRALRGYQFHPEFDADDVVALAQAHTDLLAAFGQHPAEVEVEAALARERLDPALFARSVLAPLADYLAAGPVAVSSPVPGVLPVSAPLPVPEAASAS